MLESYEITILFRPRYALDVYRRKREFENLSRRRSSIG